MQKLKNFGGEGRWRAAIAASRWLCASRKPITVDWQALWQYYSIVHSRTVTTCRCTLGMGQVWGLYLHVRLPEIQLFYYSWLLHRVLTEPANWSLTVLNEQTLGYGWTVHWYMYRWTDLQVYCNNVVGPSGWFMLSRSLISGLITCSYAGASLVSICQSLICLWAFLTVDVYLPAVVGISHPGGTGEEWCIEQTADDWYQVLWWVPWKNAKEWS